MSELGELSADAKSLVAQCRDADAPCAGDKQRIKNRLAAELGAGAFVVAAVSTTVPALLPAASSGAPALAAPSAAAHGLWKHALLKAAAAASAVGALYLGAVTLMPSSPHTAARAPMAAAPVAPPRAPPALSAAGTTSLENDVAATRPPAAREALETKPGLPALREPAARASAGAAQRAGKRTDDNGKRAAQTPAAQAPSTLGAELALLASAQRALREHQPQRALELAQQHAARFGQGNLGEERRGIEALAHCQLGEPSHASVTGFLALSPRSPLAARVRKECALR